MKPRDLRYRQSYLRRAYRASGQEQIFETPAITRPHEGPCDVVASREDGRFVGAKAITPVPLNEEGSLC